jgi:hypothetical protein
VGILTLIFISFFSYSSEPSDSSEPSGYLIDQVEDVYELSCEDCPASVGTMFAAEPILFSEIQSADQIKYSNCHVTLVDSKTVITAAHCVRPWFQNNWQDQAEQDCSRSFKFFFPETQGHTAETVGCESITPVPGHYTGVTQLFPDTLKITLDRDLNRQPSNLNQATLDFSEDKEFTLWINVPEKSRELTQVKCTWVSESAFSPADLWGQGAFTTLNCDHDVLSGTSGAGVFYRGDLIANVSHGAENHYLSGSLFDYDEVVVSKLSCFESESENCFMTYDESLEYLKEYHYKAFDLAFEWHDVVLQSITRHFNHGVFSYQKLETNNIIQNRGFYLNCVNRDTALGEDLVLGFKINQDRLDVNYVKYDEFARVIGVHYNLSGTMRPFHNSMELVKTNSFEVNDTFISVQSNEVPIDSIPFCH